MFEVFGKPGYCRATKVEQFASLLKEGRLAASRCCDCGRLGFPPRADCPECDSDRWRWEEISGWGVLHSFTAIHSAPAGFASEAPYIIGLVDLKEGGRALARFPLTVREDDLSIGMRVRVVAGTRAEDGLEYVEYHLVPE